MRWVAVLLGMIGLVATTLAQPPCPPLPRCVHTCRIIVFRTPAPPPPQLVPYPTPSQVPVYIQPPAAAPVPGPDPATIALLQQILANHHTMLANQNQILQKLAALQATPQGGCGNGSGIIVVPADGGAAAPVPIPVPTPSPAPAPATPGVTPPFVLPGGLTPPIVLPGGSTPPIALPGGSTPPITLPGGSAPPFALPGGSAPPAKGSVAPPSTMPPANENNSHAAAPLPTPQRYTVYTRYTMYEPAKRRYLYVFIPQRRVESTFVPARRK